MRMKNSATQWLVHHGQVSILPRNGMCFSSHSCMKLRASDFVSSKLIAPVAMPRTRKSITDVLVRLPLASSSPEGRQYTCHSHRVGMERNGSGPGSHCSARPLSSTTQRNPRLPTSELSTILCASWEKLCSSL